MHKSNHQAVRNIDTPADNFLKITAVILTRRGGKIIISGAGDRENGN